MRYLRAFIISVGLILLTGCPQDTSTPVVPVVNNTWYIRESTGIPATVTQGSYLTIPNSPNSINYLTLPQDAVSGGTLSVTFLVTATNPVYTLTDTTTYGPAQIHLFLQRTGDDMTGVGEMQYYRWWCGTGNYILGASTPQQVTISCPLVYTSWTSVYGLQSQTEFTNMLSNLQWAGVTFGGANGWGHGVYLTSGSSQFQIISLSIK